MATGAVLLAPEVTRQFLVPYAARIRPTGDAPEHAGLTTRELEVLRLIAEGLADSK